MKAQKLNRRNAKTHQKGDPKKPSEVKYQPKISDKDLLKIAKIHRFLLAYQLKVQKAKNRMGRGFESKMEGGEMVGQEDDGYGEEEGDLE